MCVSKPKTSGDGCVAADVQKSPRSHSRVALKVCSRAEDVREHLLNDVWWSKQNPTIADNSFSHSAAAVTFPAAERHRPLAGTKLYCVVTEAHRCE